MNYAKNRRNKDLLAKKITLFLKVSKKTIFSKNKGGTKGKFSKIADFLVELHEIRNTSLISMDRKLNNTFSEKSIENNHFSQNSKGGPKENFQKSPIFWSNFRKAKKIGNTSRTIA